MKSSKRHIAGTEHPRTPSKVALSAHLQTGGGKHGAQSRRQRSKANRKAARQQVRRDEAMRAGLDSWR